MRRTFKAIIVAVALIVAGSVLAGCGLWGLNGQWDLLTGRGKLVTTEETLSGDFTNIDADVFWLDVALLPSPDGTCTYKAYTYETMPCTVTVENGTLKIDQPDNRKPHEQIGIVQGDVYLQLYLPADTYESLTFRGRTSDLAVPVQFRFQSVTVENSTGDIFIAAQVEESLNLTCSTGDIRITSTACKDISAYVSTGDIYADNITCDNLFARTSTGCLFVDDSAVADALTLKSSTGSKRLCNVTCGSLHSQASSGDLEMINVTVAGDVNITANTGAVEFTRFDAANITIETTTGDVDGTLLSDKIFFVDSNTGDVDVPHTTTGGTCQITTDTGDIEIDIRK